MPARQPSGGEAWPEAKMMSLEGNDFSDRATRRASNKAVSARLAMGVSLMCLVAVAVIGMMHTPRPVEDIIVGSDSSRALESAATTSIDENAIVKRAVQKAMAGAAKVAREEVQRDVQDAVKDAINDAVTANTRLSAPALVKKLAVTGSVEARRAAGEEAAEYQTEMQHIQGELDSQIGSALGTAHANEHHTFKGVKPAKMVAIEVNKWGEPSSDVEAVTSHLSPMARAKAAVHASSKVSKAVDDKFLKMASAVLNHETKPSYKEQVIAYKQAVMDRKRHQVETKNEIRQYQELENQIHGENNKLYKNEDSDGSDDSQNPIRKLGRAPTAMEREKMAMQDYNKLQKAANSRKAHSKHVQHQALKKAIEEESAGSAYARTKAATDNKILAKATKGVKADAGKVTKTDKGVTTPLIKDSKGHVIPVTSKKNPAYVHEEAKRDTEAEKDLEKLIKLKEAKKKAKEHRKREGPAPPKENRGKEADEYLKIMESEKKKEEAAEVKAKPEDRNALAEHYLKQLMQTGSSAAKWVSDKLSGHTATAKGQDGEKDRNLEAKKDLSLLKKGKALVKKGDKVEKVKLSPAVVHGVDKVAETRKAIEAKEAKEAGPDRNTLAQQYLKQLKLKPVVGKPFHATKIPKAMLHPHKADRDSEAQKDLKALKGV